MGDTPCPRPQDAPATPGARPAQREGSAASAEVSDGGGQQAPKWAKPYGPPPFASPNSQGLELVKK
jgi:hypothetical protein